MDYTGIRTADAGPEASSMMETLRAIGYSLETAVADIIDNSISADAKVIEINRIWRGDKSVITIKDDGLGMSSKEIIQAMKPGSQNPLAQRSEKDLGRFGLGLKTASFSQCKRVTVLSKKKDGEPDFWTWDLDYVKDENKWLVLHYVPKDFENALDGQKSGTLVIWSEMDRIVRLGTGEGNEPMKIKFSKDLDRVKQHLSMTFHRFIEDKSLKLLWCGHLIKPWNPFFTGEPLTDSLSIDTFPGGITVKGYILPHKDQFSSSLAFEEASGMNGWNSHQGFYVYRGKRLLLAGDWLGFGQKSESTKLVRIQVDLPNTQDSDWQIDIKKSRAYPPASCRDQLEAYAKKAKNKGIEVYRHRGKILKQRAGVNFKPLWLDKSKDSKWTFVINRDNDVVRTAKLMAREKPDIAIETLLKIIEEDIPTHSIHYKEMLEQESQKKPFEGFEIEEIRELATIIYKNKIVDGLTPKQAKEYLKTVEPFNNFDELTDNLE